MINKIKKLKKIELHLHLDGSVPTDVLSKITNIDEDTIKNQVIAKDKCQNLSEYLTKFDLPIKYMQTKENLKTISKGLVDYLETQNVIYAEIRFAPILHTKKGLTYDEIIESILDGLNQNKIVKTNLILCMMRGFPEEENLKIINLAKKYLNNGVCAIDLAGAEDKYPLSNYINLFNIAQSYNIPYTIHAGENGSHKEIDLAIELKTKRIGHGIHANESIKTIENLHKNQIHLEICPTSNIQTNSIDTYDNHPIYTFYKEGIKLSINTDNKTISNISLNEEYLKLYEHFHFTIEDFIKMNEYALDDSFLNKKDKEELKIKLKQD